MSDEAPVLDPAAIERLRALAVAVARPGEDILGHLSTLFIEDSASRLTALREAWAAGHTKDAARAAHTIKGAAGNIGAARVVAAALAVERAVEAAAGVDDRLLQRLADELDTAYAALRGEFAAR